MVLSIKNPNTFQCSDFGDPYENWTHDYAVKGRRLNLLTNGPYYGGGSKTWTYDLPGMNRLL